MLATTILNTSNNYGVTEGLAEYSKVWGAIAGMITENLWLIVFLTGGLVAMAWRHFKRAKKAVR